MTALPSFTVEEKGLGSLAARVPGCDVAGGAADLWPIGSWLSAALDDPSVCEEMKRDIREWFDGGGSVRAAPRGDLHPATDDLVNRFSAALKDKLAAAEKKYGYSDGWLADGWRDDLVYRLTEHVEKGDPRDVAAFCAFAWHHNWSTASDGGAR